MARPRKSAKFLASCHSERSEESPSSARSFATLRMTPKLCRVARCSCDDPYMPPRPARKWLHFTSPRATMAAALNTRCTVYGLLPKGDRHGEADGREEEESRRGQEGGNGGRDEVDRPARRPAQETKLARRQDPAAQGLQEDGPTSPGRAGRARGRPPRPGSRVSSIHSGRRPLG